MFHYFEIGLHIYAINTNILFFGIKRQNEKRGLETGSIKQGAELGFWLMEAKIKKKQKNKIYIYISLHDFLNLKFTFHIY
jgi:hypothetical protein